METTVAKTIRKWDLPYVLDNEFSHCIFQILKCVFLNMVIFYILEEDIDRSIDQTYLQNFKFNLKFGCNFFLMYQKT